MLQLRLLGMPEVRVDGVPVTEKLSGKSQAILYYLAVTEQPQSRAALAALLWGDMPEAAARTNLRKALPDLRQELDPYLQIDRQTVAFEPEIELWIDVHEFETGVKAAGSGPVDADRLQEAVALYQGDFLTGFYVRNAPDFEAWMLAEQARLREVVIQALHTLTTHFVEQGELSQGIATVQRLLNLEPWREEAHRQLMLLLARDGQRSAALAQYDLCRQVLAEELGVEPAGETLALYERLKGVQAPIPHNLPPPGPFVGRVRVLNDLMNHLSNADCRLLTLVGPGGIGKTRLAIEGARQQTRSQQGFEGPDFSDGVYFVNLAALRLDEGGGEASYLANHLASAMAEALDISFSGSAEPMKQLRTYLRDKSLLLVLDNFEHLVSEAVVLSSILREAHSLKLLVTSRERLNLMEEWVLEIGGLDYPDPARLPPLEEASTLADVERYEAVALFAQHARQAQSHFKLTTVEAGHVIRICQLVEGIPLALVLAASWLPVLPCAGIAAEIEQSLDFLETSLQDIPDRHRSLRVVFDHSWRMLSAQEQNIFGKLSIFRGGFTREAAQQVAGASLSILARLVRKSLLRLTDAGRYELHELLRQFAAEKLQTTLSQTESTRTVHANYYGDFLQKREADLKGARQLEALAEIAAELDNVRAAWEWAVDQADVAVIGKSLESWFFFCDMQGQAQEGVRAFRRAVAAFREPDAIKGEITAREHNDILGQLIGRQGFLAIRLGPEAPTIDLMRESVSLLRQAGPEARGQLAMSLHYLGQETYLQGEPAEAVRILQESLGLATEVDEFWVMGGALQILGQTAEFQGEFAQAEPFFQKSIQVYEKIGELRDKAFALNNWGRAAYGMGNYTQAEQLLKQALTIRQEVGDLTGIGYSLIDLGKLALLQGRLADAQQFTQQALTVARDTDNHDQMARCQNGLGMICRLQGDLDQAERYHQTSLAIFNEIEIRRETPFTLNNLGHVACDQAAYPRAEQRFRESLEVSRALENKGETASALRHLGHVSRMMERASEAGDYYRQALAIVIRTGAAPVALDVFLGWTGLLSHSQATNTKLEQAVELLTFVRHHPAVTHETREKADQHLLELAADLPSAIITPAKTRGQTLDWQAVANQL